MAPSGQPVSRLVAQKVRRLPKGRPFSIRLFATLGSANAVYKAFAQLVNRGELVRAYPGIYMRPKRVQYVGWVFPSQKATVDLIAKQSRHTLQMHGANAVRRFGLSTQMPMVDIYYTSGASRKIRHGKSETWLVHAPPVAIQHPGTKVGMALSAMFYLGKDGWDTSCAAVIKKALSPDELATLMACRMPKWMRAVLETA
ncbi:hypothetical protein IB232_23240 [Pseudomonas sp. PDM15]|uniref:DUF6088 family protein n=1 Tax=Pseudomonas sp. PDM15 TaxID=2769303 RepID=UPI00177B32F1|nr:DUF6088 family protein [Pseudomonas sp. PDM15]MBD9428255.1 hypothetical protein [Pseudomonas sp. PDM15]